MARKGNPISVRLDLNRSSDSSWFSDVYQDLNLRSYLFVSECKRKLTLFLLGFGKKLPAEMQVISLFFFQFLGMSLLLKGGILLMDELGEAIRPFLPHLPAGMPGEGGAAPGPFGHGGPDLLYAPNEENERHELVGEVREPPLIEDSVRREELERLSYSRIEGGVEAEWNDERIQLQFELEKRLEYALREDGFTENSIMETRFEWRREALTLTSREKFLSISTLRKNLARAEIRASPAYRKVMRATSYNHTHGHIHLRKEVHFPT